MKTIGPDQDDWVPRINAFMLHLAIILVAILAALFFATPAHTALEQRVANSAARDRAPVEPGARCGVAVRARPCARRYTQ